MPHNPTPRAPLRRESRSASFHGRTAAAPAAPRPMRRPKTHPDLLAGGSGWAPPVSAERRVPTKVVMNVTVQRSLGPLQVMASTDWTVRELVAASLKQYRKEGRRPLLPTAAEASAFGLHYSQFSLERADGEIGLDTEEKLVGLGSRNFFLCPKHAAVPAASVLTETTSSAVPATCNGEADKASKIGIPWLRFMDFLL